MNVLALVGRGTRKSLQLSSAEDQTLNVCQKSNLQHRIFFTAEHHGQPYELREHDQTTKKAGLGTFQEEYSPTPLLRPSTCRPLWCSVFAKAGFLNDRCQNNPLETP